MVVPTAQILDGKAASKNLLDTLTQELSQFSGAKKPKLVVILVGNNPASEIYVGRKTKIAAQIGLDSELCRLPENISQPDLLAHLARLNHDPSVHAVLVQLPLPPHLDTNAVLLGIDLNKDVDGFHPENLGKLVMGIEPPALPCTPAGIMNLMDAYDVPMAGRRVAVVGRSNIVGKPIAVMMLHRDATVTICHSRTRNLGDILQESDIIVAAAGRPGLVERDAVKPGAAIVDVGINRLPSGEIVGDVDYHAVSEKAGWITPVPGGVGPMTIAMLMMNTVRLFRHQQGQPIPNLIFR